MQVLGGVLEYDCKVADGLPGLFLGRGGSDGHSQVLHRGPVIGGQGGKRLQDVPDRGEVHRFHPLGVVVVVAVVARLEQPGQQVLERLNIPVY